MVGHHHQLGFNGVLLAHFDDDFEGFSNWEGLMVEDLQRHGEELVLVAVEDGLGRRDLNGDPDRYNLVAHDLLIDWQVLHNQWELFSLGA